MKRIRLARFRYYLTGIIVLIILCSTGACKSNNKTKTETISICTEERMKLIVEDVMKYFNDTRETPVDFQVTYIPENENERAGMKELASVNGSGQSL